MLNPLSGVQSRGQRTLYSFPWAPRASAARVHTRLSRAVAGPFQASDEVQTPPAPSAPSSASGMYPLPVPPRTPRKDAIIMQGFGWESCKRKDGFYTYMLTKIPEMVALGVTHLWLPPPSQSVDDRGYLPGQLYNLNSKYGTREQLVELCRALKAANIAPVADVVINHRCAEGKDEKGIYNVYGDDVDHRGRKINWGKWAVTGDDPVFGGQGNPDTGDDYGAAPDLDHLNPELRQALKDWLGWLTTDIGFEGWRLDFARGYAGRFVAEYADASVGRQDALIFGEYWTDVKWDGSFLEYSQDESRQRLCDWIKSTENVAAAIDFTTKALLQEALKRTEYDRLRGKDGKASGLLGWWGERAVTFIENHDTGSTQQHWPFPSKGVEEGYAYILTHPGMPCIFVEHAFDWGTLRDRIAVLSAVRKRNAIQSDAKMTIKCAEKDMYIAEIVGAKGTVAIKMGPRFDMGNFYVYKADKGWTKAASGEGYAIWEKAN